jgi:plasmid maintenance system killer protein
MSVSYIELLSQLEKQIQKDEVKLDSHLCICLEINAEGMPSAQVIKVSADPYEVIGLVEVAVNKLHEIRDNIIERFKKSDEVSRIMNKLPKNLANKLDEFDEEIKNALESKDVKAMEDLKNKIMRALNNEDKDDKKDDDTDDNGFNINDFKSGF